MSTKIGKANYGSKYTKKKWAKLTDGESVFRILPPLGDLADKGIWSVFYNIHYGYKNSEGKLRTFQSPLVKNRKTKMIETPDAALDRINALKAQLEKAKLAGNGDMTEKLLKLVGPKGQFNLDSNHYMNAVDLQGNIVILKIRHRAKLALDATIKALRESGVDPLSADNGRFFIFRRTGMGLDTSFQVTVYQQKLNVAGIGDVNKDLVHALNDELISRLGSEAAELNKLFKILTAEQVERIVKEGPVAVDDIFDTKKEEAVSAQPEESEDDLDDYSAPGSATPTSLASPTIAAVTPVAVVISNPVAPKPVSVDVVTSKPTAVVVNEMSDDEFLKTLGL